MTNVLSGTDVAGFMAIVKCAARLNRAVDRNLAAHGGLTRVQLEILIRLSQEPDGLRMSELANRLVHSRSGLTYQVTQLEKMGLVIRGRGTESERAVVARITEAGEEVRHAFFDSQRELVRTHLVDILTPEELETVTSSLERVIARFDEDSAA